jgi:hypothetical protein
METWTHQKPECGHYWYRETPDSQPESVEVVYRGGYYGLVAVRSQDRSEPISKLQGEWMQKR